jgi:hypothetical protein
MTTVVDLQLLGHWQGIEELYPSGGGAVITARTAVTFTLAVADLLVVQDYRRVLKDGRELLGHGVFQQQPGRVLWWFFDSSGRRPEPAEGEWRDGALVLTVPGPAATAVHRYGIEDGDLTYRVDSGFSAADPQPELRGRFRRMSTH